LIPGHDLIFAVFPSLLGKYDAQKEGKNKKLREKTYAVFLFLSLLINLLMFLYPILKIFKDHFIII